MALKLLRQGTLHLQRSMKLEANWRNRHNLVNWRGLLPVLFTNNATLFASVKLGKIPAQAVLEIIDKGIHLDGNRKLVPIFNNFQR